MTAPNIKDPITEKTVRELAELTGETVTAAVLRRRRTSGSARRRRSGRSLAEIMEIGRQCAALPDLDTRSADEILGYDDDGMPSQWLSTLRP